MAFIIWLALYLASCFVVILDAQYNWTMDHISVLLGIGAIAVIAAPFLDKGRHLGIAILVFFVLAILSIGVAAL